MWKSINQSQSETRNSIPTLYSRFHTTNVSPTQHQPKLTPTQHTSIPQDGQTLADFIQKDLEQQTTQRKQ